MQKKKKIHPSLSQTFEPQHLLKKFFLLQKRYRFQLALSAILGAALITTWFFFGPTQASTTETITVTASTGTPGDLDFDEGYLNDIDVTTVANQMQLETGGGAGDWWDTNYLYRKQLTVENNSGGTMATNTLVKHEFDHASLTTDKSLASGNDVRIVYDTGAGLSEIAREKTAGSSWDNSATTIYFRTQASISASSTSTSYYMYYGYASAGTPPTDIGFGDGADGPVTISSDTATFDSVKTKLTTAAAATNTSLTVNSSSGFTAGDEVLIIELQGTSANYNTTGNYEFRTIESVGAGNITVTSGLTNAYDSTAEGLDTTIQKVFHYTNVTVDVTKTWSPADWANSVAPSGQVGGIVAFRATGTVLVNGSISTTGKGLRGGSAAASAKSGETYNGATDACTGGGSTAAATGTPSGGACGAGSSNATTQAGTVGGAGGAGGTGATIGAGGAGAGYGTVGRAGQNTGGTAGNDGSGTTGGSGTNLGTNAEPGGGGGTYGANTLSTMFFGSGGGGGSNGAGTAGGDGGGLIFIAANTVTMGASGSIVTNGNAGAAGGDNIGGAGGGSGGTIWLDGGALTLGTGSLTMTATGGAGGDGKGATSGSNGGNGGDGRIRLDYDTLSITGTTNPQQYTDEVTTTPTVTADSELTNYQADGQYISTSGANAIDLVYNEAWTNSGSCSFKANVTVPSGGDINFFIRTSANRVTWSSWKDFSAVTNSADDDADAATYCFNAARLAGAPNALATGANRFVQVRADMTTTGGATPVITDYALTFTQELASEVAIDYDTTSHTDTTEAFFDAGTHSSTDATTTSGGELTLGTGGASNWLDTNYQYRKQLTISNTASAPVPTDTLVKLALDHSALVTASKSLASGNDVRIAYGSGAQTEIDRLIKDSTSWNSSGTVLYFRTQASIAAGSPSTPTTNSNYYLYYGYSGASTPPTDVGFGDGADGPLTIGDGVTTTVDDFRTKLTGDAAAGASSLTVYNTSGFAPGDEVLIIEIQGVSTDYGSTGNYEFRTIQSIGDSTLTITPVLSNAYSSTVTAAGVVDTMVQKVMHYTDVTLTGTGTLTNDDWADSVGFGTTSQEGGIIAFRATGMVSLSGTGTISAGGKGLRGGSAAVSASSGETYNGATDACTGGGSTAAATGTPSGGACGAGDSNTSTQAGTTGGAGGAGGQGSTIGAGGGGAGYGTVGLAGQNSGGTAGNDGSGTTGGSGTNLATTAEPGGGGGTYGANTLSTMFLGSGGGGGSTSTGTAGGDGGGLIFIAANMITIADSGTIVSTGNAGAAGGTNIGGAGGGSGGTIWLDGGALTLGTGSSTVTATGGAGGDGKGATSGSNGGNGGDGRIRLDYDTISITGTTNPQQYTDEVSTATSGNPPSVAAASEIRNVNASGTHTTPTSGASVIDLTWNGAWTASDNGCAFEASISQPTGTSIAFRARSAATTAGLTSATWYGLTDESDDASVYCVQPDNMPALPTAANRYVQVETTLTSTSGNNPIVNDLNFYYLDDTVNPSANPTATAYDSSALGTTFADNSWQNDTTPYFAWTGAADATSGIDDYCVYFGISSTADPCVDGSIQTATTLSPTISSCSPAVTYYLRIQARDHAENEFTSADTSDYTLHTYRCDAVDPTNPTSITVTPSGYTSTQDSFDFQWNAGTDADSGIDSYDYITGEAVGPDSGSVDVLAAREVNDFSAYQEGVNVFKVRAVDEAGNTADAYLTVNYYYNASAPTPPLNLETDAASYETNLVDVTWDEPESFNGSIDHYEYSVNALPTANNTTSTSSSETSARTLTDKPLGTVQGPNIFYLVAVDEIGNVNYDAYAQVTFSVATPAPGIPRGVVIADSSNREEESFSLTTTWLAPTGDVEVDHYVVERALVADPDATDDDVADEDFAEVATTTGTGYIDTTLDNETTYFYRIKASDNAESIGAESSIVYEVPTGRYTEPAEIVGSPSVESVSITTATISWITERDSDSCIQYGISTDYGSEQCNSVQAQEHEVTVVGLTGGTDYHARAKWTDIDGNTGYSSDFEFTTSDAPGAPQNLTVDPDSNTINSFSFAWEQPIDAESDDVIIKQYRYAINQAALTEDNTTRTTETEVGPSPFATQQGTNTFCVVAEDTQGNVNYNSKACVNFTATTEAPGIPTNVIISDSSNREAEQFQLTIAWLPPDTVADENDTVTYIVQRAEIKDPDAKEDDVKTGDFEDIAQTTNTAHLDTNLSNKNTYYYRIIAQDSAGAQSAESSIVFLQPEGRYTTPPEITVKPTIDVGTFDAAVTWQTERPTKSFVEYGLKETELDLVSGNPEHIDEHEITIDGLAEATKYYYRVHNIDIDENESFSDVASFTTEPAPRILDVAIGDITLNSALITWNTNKDTTTALNYGLDTSYGITISDTSSSLTISHTVKMTNLSDDTTYNIQLLGEDNDENSIASDNYSFKTLTFPRVFDVTTENKAEGETEVRWKSNVPTTSVVEYYSENQSPRTQGNEALVTDHVLLLFALEDAATYTYTVLGTDAFGNQATSGKETFTTLADTTPPEISKVLSESLTTGSGENSKVQIVISWKTNEPATSQVFFGQGSGTETPSKTQENAELVRDHLLVLSDLEPAKTYHFKVFSRDKANNQTESSIFSALTTRPRQSFLQIIISNLEDTFAWVGNFAE